MLKIVIFDRHVLISIIILLLYFLVFISFTSVLYNISFVLVTFYIFSPSAFKSLRYHLFPLNIYIGLCVYCNICACLKCRCFNTWFSESLVMAESMFSVLTHYWWKFNKTQNPRLAMY